MNNREDRDVDRFTIHLPSLCTEECRISEKVYRLMDYR